MLKYRRQNHLYKKSIFSLIWILCNGLFCVCQAEENYFITSSVTKASLDKYIYYIEDKSHQLPVADIIKSKWNQPDKKPFNAGFTGSDYWFKLNIENKSGKKHHLLVELANPNLNQITLYTIHEIGSIDTGSTIGDRFVFDHRNTISPTLMYKIVLDSGEMNTYIFKVSNDYKQLHVPFVLWDADFYAQKSKQRSYLHGSLIGFIAFFLIISFIVCLFAKSKLLNYYWMYTASFSLYLIALLGIGFQLLWPGNVKFQSYAMELSKYATGFFFIPFVIHFFNTKINFSKWHRVLSIMMFAFILVAVMRLLYVYTSFISPGLIMIITQITSVGLILGDMVIWNIAFSSYKKSKKWEELWVLIVCTMFFVSLVLMVSLHLGWIPGWNWVENFLVIGYVTEIIVLSTVLAYRYYILYRTNYQLAIDLGKAKEAAIHTFLQGQNEERKRLSEQLHDGISLTLASLKMRLSHIKSVSNQAEVKDILSPLIDDVGQTAKEIRNISHSLSPLILKKGSIASALEDLTERARWAYPHLQIHWHPVLNKEEEIKLPDHISQNIYYIASELINNATKHADAHEIHVDFVKSENAVELKIKDDGKGYDITKAFKGIGLEHIRQRVQLLNGSFEVNKLDRGMLHCIRFAIT